MRNQSYGDEQLAILGGAEPPGWLKDKPLEVALHCHACGRTQKFLARSIKTWPKCCGLPMETKRP